MIHRATADLASSARRVGASSCWLRAGPNCQENRVTMGTPVAPAGCGPKIEQASPEDGRDGLHANSILRSRHSKSGQRRSLNSLQPRRRVSVKRTGVQAAQRSAFRQAPRLAALIIAAGDEAPVNRQPPAGVGQHPRPRRNERRAVTRGHRLLRPVPCQESAPGQRRAVRARSARSARRASRAQRAM